MRELNFNDNYTDLWIDEPITFNEDEPKTIADLFGTDDDDFLFFSEDADNDTTEN